MRNRYFEDEALKKGMTKAHTQRLLTYLMPYRQKILMAMGLILATGVLSSIGPYLLKVAFDEAIPNKDIKGLIVIVAAIGLIVVVNIQLFKVRVKLVTEVGQSAIHQIREDVFIHLQALPFRYYDERPHGKIIVRVVNYINAISNLLSQGIIAVSYTHLRAHETRYTISFSVLGW